MEDFFPQSQSGFSCLGSRAWPLRVPSRMAGWAIAVAIEARCGEGDCTFEVDIWTVRRPNAVRVDDAQAWRVGFVESVWGGPGGMDGAVPTAARISGRIATELLQRGALDVEDDWLMFEVIRERCAGVASERAGF